MHDKDVGSVSDSSFRRVSVSLLVTLELVGSPPLNWLPGPMRTVWRGGTSREVNGSRAGRLAYVNPWIAPLVYDRKDASVRRHLFLGTPLPLGMNGTLDAMELVTTVVLNPFPTGILVLHASLNCSDTSELRAALDQLTNHNIRHRTSTRDWIESLTNPWARIHRTHRRAQHVTLVTRGGDSWPNWLSGSDGAPDDDVMLALVGFSGRYRPDPAWNPAGVDERQRVRLVRMSDNLRGLVTRDGLAIIGLNRDDGGSGGAHGFDYDGAEFFARGLYVDTMLVLAQQRLALDAIEFDFRQARANPSLPAIQSIEGAVDHYRNSIWGTGLAPQGSQDDVLGGMQAVGALVSRDDQLTESLSELSSRLRRDEQERIGVIIRTVTLIGVPATVVWNLLVDRNVIWRANFLYGIATVLVLLVFLRPGIRGALGLRFDPPSVTHLRRW